MNIAITTLGQSWAVIPELIGFLDPSQYDFFANHPRKAKIDALRKQFSVISSHEIWIVATQSEESLNTIEKVKEWIGSTGITTKIKFWTTESIVDLFDPEQCLEMRDAVLRLTLMGRQTIGKKTPMLFSLVGGRKTMSSDIQYAASFFGPGLLIHITDRNIPTDFRNPQPQQLTHPPCEEVAAAFMPVVVGRYPENRLSYHIDASLYNLPWPSETNILNGIAASTALAEEVESTLYYASNLFFHHVFDTTFIEKESNNYSRLFVLPPNTIEDLRDTHIGVDPGQKEEELSLLQQLPKAELHCHLGGSLTIAETVNVAACHREEVAFWEKQHKGFREKRKWWRRLVEHRDLEEIKAAIAGPHVRDLRAKLFPEIPPPITVCGFLLCFEDDPPILEKCLWDPYAHEENFYGVGIEAYERLGDLQGSALLQSEKTIRAAVQITLQKLVRENVKYVELRCSPHNYTRGGCTAPQAYGFIEEELENFKSQIESGIIVIASRHRELSEVYRVLSFLTELIDHRGSNCLVGVDLAGDEKKLPPSRLREAFLPIMDHCMHITIHAGENNPAENIWQAVYYLSAERIGHGLSLGNNPQLAQKFLDRGIGIEMCPSSNKQIVGFPNHSYYPLQQFLDQGLKVSVNTDNLGISRTTPSRELHQAATLSRGGLAVMEVLQLIKNGFSSAFIDHDTRKRLLLDSESSLLKLFQKRGSVLHE